MVLLFATGTWFALEWANSPVKQRIVNESISAPTTEPTNATIDVKTDYFSTKLPAEYRVEVAKNPTNPKMVNVSAFTSKESQTQVGITTAPLPTEGLQGVADYEYRMKEKKLYTQLKSTLFSSDSFDFEKIGGGEFTTFIVQNDRYASITVSGQGISINELQALRQIIAAHWAWI